MVTLEEAALAVDPLAGRLIPANLLRLQPGNRKLWTRRNRRRVPNGARMDPPKGHIFVDSFPFEEPNHRGKPKKSRTPRRATTRKPKAKQKTTNRKKATPQPRTPKPRVEPTPAEVEAKQERRRKYERQRDQTPDRKEL